MTPARFAILLLSACAMAYYHLHQMEARPAAREPAQAAPSPPQVFPPSPPTAPAGGENEKNSGALIKREPRDSREFATQLAAINACYQSEDCDYPQTDPHSYHFAVGLHLRATLTAFTAWVQREKVGEEAVSQSAREFLASSDGFVQEAALKLMATQEPSPENLQAILDDVLGGYDAELIDLALVQLERYTSVADSDKISAALARAITTGAPFLAREVSVHIAPFLHARNSEFFAQVARDLPEGSIYRINLEASLKNL